MEWGPNTVTLTMTIAVTKGSLTDYTFFIMENQSTDIHQASQPLQAHSALVYPKATRSTARSLSIAHEPMPPSCLPTGQGCPPPFRH
ncbi:glucoamylase S1/S2 precursor [Cutibacterium acnes JCM 18920]|nr:glucoamylase S1/S2 precursor [Cutibacterium acnes JCM 18920]